MFDIIVGAESILPYHDLLEARTLAVRTIWIRTRPWARTFVYAVTLLGCGVSATQRISTAWPAYKVLALSPVIVNAPDRTQWPLEWRSDTLATILINQHVDSATAVRWARDFVYFGEQTHINPHMLLAIAYAESEFNPHAHSAAGAIGLMQIVPARAWWREYEPRCGPMSASTLHDPHVNICFGAHIYREFLTRHQGDTDRALAAYNNGSGELNGYPDRVYASLSALRIRARR